VQAASVTDTGAWCIGITTFARTVCAGIGFTITVCAAAGIAGMLSYWGDPQGGACACKSFLSGTLCQSRQGRSV